MEWSTPDAETMGSVRREHIAAPPLNSKTMEGGEKREELRNLMNIPRGSEKGTICRHQGLQRSAEK